MPAIRIEASRLAQAIETQEMVLREEQARTAELQDRIEAARKVMDGFVRELETSANRLSIYTQALNLYHDLHERNQTAMLEELLLPDGNKSVAAPRPKPARLGKQHYRMLHAIRSNGILSLADLATASHVSPRRVKLQMIEDAHNHLIVLSGNEYELTVRGSDLLKRFEDYRRSNGQELPPLDPLQGEDDQDEVDPENPTEEGEA